MPRKRRSAKRRLDLPLSEAARYLLLTGMHAQSHYCGAFSGQRWNCEVRDDVVPCTPARHVPGLMDEFLEVMEAPDFFETLWDNYRDELTREAKQYGFRPAAASGFPLEPLPLDVTASWRAVFIQQHGGRPVVRPLEG